MPYKTDRPMASLFPSEPAERMCRRVTDRCVDRLHDDARALTPVGKPLPGHSMDEFVLSRNRKPGTARAAWKRTDVKIGKTPTGTTRYSAEAFNDDPLIELIEYPTRPHVIRPRKDRAPASQYPRNVGDDGKNVLRGTVQDGRARLRIPVSGGGFAFAKEVNHPGTEGKHMTRDALAMLDAQWVDTIGAQEVERWAREMETS